MRRALPELPDARRTRFVREYGLPEYDADVLTMRKDVADYYEDAVRHHRNPKALSNWVMGDVLAHHQGAQARQCPGDPRLAGRPGTPGGDGRADRQRRDQRQDRQVGVRGDGEHRQDAGADRRRSRASRRSPTKAPIVAAIDAVLAANPDKVAEYRGGKDKLFGFFVGQVMKATQGKANPQKLNELLRAKLSA